MHFFKSVFILLFVLINFASFAQEQITGTIVDNKNIPIPGATISLKNSTNTFGKLTDNTGQFEINAPSGNYKIEVRYLGFKAYKNTVEISEGTPLDIGTIQLEEGAEQLQTVEVIGRVRKDYNSDYSFSATKIAIKNKELPQAVATVPKPMMDRCLMVCVHVNTTFYNP